MNADGTQVIERRFINTHELVVSQDPDDCLGSSHSCSCFFQFLSMRNLS